jgi:PAS domain S-box-containing protein
MAPNYLQRIYDQAGFNRSGSISLYRTDGTLLIRHPEAGKQINRSFGRTELFSEALKKAPSGTIDSVSPVDGVRRITSYRKIEGAPLVVAVSESYDEVLADWRKLVDRYIALAGLIAVAVSGLAYALHRQAANRTAADARFRAAMDAASNAFILLSPSDRIDGSPSFVIRDANIAAGTLLGLDRDQLVGRSLASVAPKVRDNDITAICAETYETGKYTSTTVVYLQLDSPRRWLRVRTTRYADGVVLSIRDATEEQEARDALEIAKDSAETANRAKSDFLANMSHELRTPLNAVIGFADIIQQQLFGPVGSERYREYATLIRMSGSHLLEIISDILDLAKVEANRVVLDEREMEIPPLLHICATLVAGRAEQAGVRVVVNAEVGLPSLRADELRLKQIVLNLLSNAVKFSPAGSEVRLGARLTDEGDLAIVVSDRGCGMTPAEIELALQPFGQASSSIAKSKEGTGLGLPLARRMTEIHGGRLDIVSVPDEGTVVTVLLPAARVVAPPLAKAV